jgi:hypothetical protein
MLTIDLIHGFLTYYLSKWRRYNFFLDFIKLNYIFQVTETAVVGLLRIICVWCWTDPNDFCDDSVFQCTVEVFVLRSQLAIRVSCLSLAKFEITLLASLSSHVAS